MKKKSPPPQGKLANKHFNPYLNGIYVVKFVNDQLCVLVDPISELVIYQHVRFVKLYKPRSEIFNELGSDYKKLMGSPFEVSDLQEKSKLLEFLTAHNFDNFAPFTTESLKYSHSSGPRHAEDTPLGVKKRAVLSQPLHSDTASSPDDGLSLIHI